MSYFRNLRSPVGCGVVIIIVVVAVGRGGGGGGCGGGGYGGGVGREGVKVLGGEGSKRKVEMSGWCPG